ncbi:MAG TPA: putative capsular polysaccharide synthesis family protein [Rhodothermales bacterium]|nr:putative capsular polysaccharide synthesis family protein [Rhodothermales bacterium]
MNNVPVISRTVRRAGKRLKEIVPDQLVEQIQMYLQDFVKRPPILVYQMGKVGSMSIYEALQRARLRNPVYHVHFLSPIHLEQEIQRFAVVRKETAVDPKALHHLHTGRLLHEKLRRKPDVPLYIVTGVREPVSWALSRFFQHVHYFCPELLDEDGTAREQETLEYLQGMFARLGDKRNPATDWFDVELASKWFDVEFKDTLGIDVYQKPFDREKGYSILESGRQHVLILRQEDLRKTLPGVLRGFLPTDQPIEIKEANVGSKRMHGHAYSFVKNHLSISPEICERLYSTKYVRHFYDDEEIAGFVGKWRDRAVEVAV